MLNRLKDAALWVWGIEQYRRGNIGQASISLSKVRGGRKETSEFHAIMATLALISGDHKKAEQLFRIALDGSEPTKAIYRPYIDHYCGYYLSSLDGNEGAKVKHLEDALRLSAPSIIKQWLPLS